VPDIGGGGGGEGGGAAGGGGGQAPATAADVKDSDLPASTLQALRPKALDRVIEELSRGLGEEGGAGEAGEAAAAGGGGEADDSNQSDEAGGAAAAVGPGRYCLPYQRHPTRFESSLLELNGVLSRGDQICVCNGASNIFVI